MADLKNLARRIFHETLAAVDIPLIVQRKLQLDGTVLQCENFAIDMCAFTKLRVVAIGKAAHSMTEALHKLLPRRTQLQGIVSAPTPPNRSIEGIRYFAAGHPIPNQESWAAAQAILASLQDCDEQTLVFFLLSGGGSALVELPLDSRITLHDVRELYRLLVTCGAPITAINTVRKHVSAVKGGRSAVAATRATKITLAVSDVPVGRESAIASGPTLPDPSTIADAQRILREYNLREKLPAKLREWIHAGNMPETPKEGHPAFANAHFSLLLGLDDLFHPAHHATEAKGFLTCCDNTTDDWPVEKAADYLLAQLNALRAANPGHRVALIADGEVSSPVTGNGIGGRNSAFVLTCVEKIAGRRIAVLSAGTDGIDGNSPAAGAIADGDTLARAQASGLDWRASTIHSDAHTFFARLDDAIITGPTGSNLRDLRILLAGL